MDHSPFTLQRLREEYTIGCIAWYEIQVGAGVAVLGADGIEPEKVEFFRHVMARNKLMMRCLDADKIVAALEAGTYVPAKNQDGVE